MEPTQHMTPTAAELLAPIEARRILGISGAYLRRLDRQLQPTLDARGNRQYDRSRLDAFAGERVAKKSRAAARRKPRATPVTSPTTTTETP